MLIKNRLPHLFASWSFFFILIGFTHWANGQAYSLKKVVSLVPHPHHIVLDGKGNMYISSLYSVIKLSSTGNYIKFIELHDAGEREVVRPGGFKMDALGNFYVLNNKNYTVQKFDSTGRLLMQFGSSGAGDGQFRHFAQIALDIDGNIYITDNQNHSVQKFDTQGKFLLKFGKYGTANGEFKTFGGIVVDLQKNIYVTDIYNNRVQKFDAAGKFLLSIGSSSGTNEYLYQPERISVDTEGSIYVTSNQSLKKFDAKGNFVLSFPVLVTSQKTYTTFSGVTCDLLNNVYVADATNSRIYKYTTSGKRVATFLMTDWEDVLFYYGTDIVLDAHKNIYAAANSRIHKYDRNGALLLQFNAVQGSQPANSGHMVVDLQENIYISDYNCRCIRKFDAGGKFLFSFGSSGKGSGQFNNPTALATDVQANLYVVDADNHRIQKFDSKGKFLLSFGSYGKGDGQFIAPKDVAIDRVGNIYVADVYKARIQKFNSKGQFLQVLELFGDIDKQFAVPTAITLDIQGNIFVADKANNVVYQFDSQKKLVEKIPVHEPSALTIDSEGNLYTLSHAGIFMYATTKIHTKIRGYVFSDENQNCIADSSEKRIGDVLLLAQPGNYYGITQADGSYEIVADTGSYVVSQVFLPSMHRTIQPICPANNQLEKILLRSNGEIVDNVNFADKLTIFPWVSVHVASTRRRRCFTSITDVTYVNTGYGDAENVKVYVKMPTYVVLKSADKPYVLDKDSNYVFTIGTLKAGQSGQIQIKDSVVCQRGITGLTVCTKAWITPANSVTPKPSWDQSDITLKGQCIENGRVRFVLTNSGTGSMADSSEFRVFLNAQLSLRKNFKLAKGDSLVLRIPANGRTVRLEANQRPDHPRKSQSSLTLEGCVASASDKPSTGFVNQLPQDDAEAEVSVECLPIIDSYDPNDKQVSPIGTTTQHFTPTTSELKYLIRFQNTGTDTAYTVTVTDTLSEYLDISTFQQGASSHSYTFHVSGKGRPVLTFTFNNINLPDSTRNQLASNGFIQFSITPKAGLAEKTLIENFADIFFDYNDPIRTNTTANRIYDVPPVVDVVNALPVNEVVLRKPQIATLAAALIGGKTTITIDGNYFEKVADKNTVTINGIQATVIEASEGKLVVTIPTPKDPISGKITVRTDGGEAVSELEIVLGSEAEIALHGVRLYPNPSSGLVTVDFTQTQERVSKIVVYNSVGKQVLVHVPQRKAESVSELDLSGFGSGMYLISIQAGEKQLTRKVVVQ